MPYNCAMYEGNTITILSASVTTVLMFLSEAIGINEQPMLCEIPLATARELPVPEK